MTIVCAQPDRESGFLPKPVLTIGQLAARTAETAVRALLREAEAGPKPGLVDRFGPGVHTDMDISHFRLSAVVLRPFFESITLESSAFMIKAGQTGRGMVNDTMEIPAAFARTLRNLGLQAESAMLAATGGVNTHKGAIWTLGLLCAAIGSAGRSRGSFLEAEAVCTQAARFAQAILHLEESPGSGTDAGLNKETLLQPGRTKGLAAREAYGLRSARDEALEGFPSIQDRALPLARNLRFRSVPEDVKVISVLLAVMCEAEDTCLVARGGLPGLQKAQSTARQVLDGGGPFSGAGGVLYRKMVAEFRNDGLSPGGSADLCAATLFLDDIEAEDWTDCFVPL